MAAGLFSSANVPEKKKTIFTLTGGHIAPILTASEELGIRVVDVRHEATAAFAADAMSRTTGLPGVCVVTAGPGLSNTITAVKNAQMAQSPLILLGGATSDLLKGRGSLQDIDQFALLAPHTKWMGHVSRVADIVPMLEEAFYRAREGVPGPVFLEFPLDVLYKRKETTAQFEKDKPKGPGLFNAVARWYIGRHVTHIFSDIARIQLHKPIPVPLAIAAGWQVAQAAKMLGGAKKPVLLIGAQAVMMPELTKGLVDAVTALGAPVWLSSCGRGLLGANHSLQFRHARGEALKEADVVLLAGVVMDFRLQYGLGIRGHTRIISINLDKSDLYKNRSPTLAILADPAKAIAQIGEVLRAGKHDAQQFGGWLAECRAREEKRDQQIAGMAKEKNELINPVHLCQEIEKAMGPDALIVADGGDIVGTFAYNVKPRGPRKWLDPGPFGTLGVGGGFALGAGCAHPGQELWIIWGDGACGFSIAEFDTFVRHKIPLIAIVGNDACWTQIVRDQVRFLGRATGGMLTYQNYDQVAKGFGGEGILVRAPEDVAPALAQAKQLFHEGKSVLVNCLLGRSNFREGSLSM